MSRSLRVRSWLPLVAALAVLALVGSIPALAAARPPARSLLLQPRYNKVRGVGQVAGGLHASRQYLAVTDRAEQTTVINDHTGARQRLAPGCDATALGGPVLVGACPQNGRGQASLIDLRTRQTSTLTINPALVGACQTPADSLGCPWVSAIGDNWISITSITGNHHQDYITRYQSRTTGLLFNGPGGPGRRVDLNSPQLAVATCRPLTVPQPTDSGAVWPGTIVPIGHRFQLVTGHQSYLERCGTHERIHLFSLSHAGSLSTSGCTDSQYCPPATNGHVVVWSTENPDGYLRSISGIAVPSLRRFTITPPTKRMRYALVALSNAHLWITTAAGDTLWRASAPTLSRSHRSA